MTSIRRLVPLLVAAGILLAGNGLQGTFLVIRANDEGFTPEMIGLMGSIYFLGFIIACIWAPKMIQNVGHIRVFAALAALSAASVLVMSMLITPVVWIVARGLAGFCFSGLFTVIESWINAQAENEDRGRVISIYRIIDLLSVAGAQLFLPLIGITGFEIFAFTAIIFCLSLVPIALVDRTNPKPPSAFRFDLKFIWLLSPSACLAVIGIGMTTAAFRMVGPLYATEMGLDLTEAVFFMISGIIGGIVLQYPLGSYSDRFNRRGAMLIATLGAAISGIFLTMQAGAHVYFLYLGAFMFGAFAMPLYSLAAARANDLCQEENYVLLSAGLMFFYSVGAIIGPYVASILINTYGVNSFFVMTSCVHAALIIMTLIRMVIAPDTDDIKKGRFVNILRTSPVFFRMAKKAANKTDNTQFPNHKPK